MAPTNPKWEDEDDSSSSPASPIIPTGRRSKWDDEEEEDSDVIESWDAADDSEEEEKKQKAAAERKAIADAEALANKKTKAQRIAERIAQKAKSEESSSEEDEDESAKRERLRKTEQDSDLLHAEDLLGSLGNPVKRSAAKSSLTQDPSNPENPIDISALPLFNPNNKESFAKLRDTLGPVISAHSKKAQYQLFLQEFSKLLAKDLASDQIKKIASGLTALSNEKLKEEKLAERGGKKSKAAKGKVALVASRDTISRADVTSYDDNDNYDE
ncbi:MAG: Translation initiation factor 3 subunit J component [Trizodia sp. TS-e1964]|nr:MAG: Translation initiation factor 3 subunit J component [Trizodia sp. TS-e1964]